MGQVLLSGNEAVARGAWEAGVSLGVGYPGTPSTEVLENLSRFEGVVSEWAPNEKVALEVASGASMAGARTLVTMKHVGLNVAADPLYTLAYTGVRGGLVVFVADDPGMHSSQNEQDTRMHALAAHVPVLEPSDSAEAHRFTKRAFEMSEEFDVPVILRSVTRLSHSKGLVELGERVEKGATGYSKDVSKYVMMPAFARGRRADLEERFSRLAESLESSELNQVEPGEGDFGVVVAGVAYHHVREVLPDAPVFKLGVVHPLPETALRRFAEEVGRLVVVEELSDLLFSRISALGIPVEAADVPRMGELRPSHVAAAFGLETPQAGCERFDGLPSRPPLLCAGCPHRGVFWALRRLRAVVTGDIGCYTLGTLPPLSSMDSCLCMGASIGMAHGLSLIQGATERPVVAVIGDSTFAHSGLTGLAHVAYNRGSATVVILDNRTTAMTGHQDNPVTGRTLMGEETWAMDLEEVARALGAETVVTVDPHDLGATEAALRSATAATGLSVVVAKAPCALLERSRDEAFAVDEDACTACMACIRLGCPAISKGEDGGAVIDVSQCVGCGDCVQVCKFDAIVPAGAACDVGGGAR